MLRQPCVGQKILLDQGRDHSGQQPRVTRGRHGQVDVGQVRGFGTFRVDDDQRAIRILGDFADHRTGAIQAVGVPGVLAQENHYLGVFEIAMGPTAHQALGHPELAGLLLRQRIGPVAHAQRLHRGARIRTRQMISLTATAVIEDLVAAMRVAYRGQLRSDLADRRIPVNGLVAAIGTSTHRAQQPVGAILIVVQPRSLIAKIAPRAGVRLVTSGPCNRPTILGELHLDAAVQRAQHAGGRFPFGIVGSHRVRSFNQSASNQSARFWPPSSICFGRFQ